MSTPSIHKIYCLLLPFAGMGLFILFYVIAALFYPGGSYLDPDRSGFSFMNNYLCDLLDDRAINGTLNVAHNYARLALAFLCLSMITIWYQLPKLFAKRSIFHPVIRFAGISSMLTTLFLRSGTHDNIVRIAGMLGFIALIALFIEFFKEKYYKLLLMGIFSLILVAINYYVYETGNFVLALPVIQKISFIACIGWFLILMVSTYNKLELSDNESTTIDL